MNFNGQLTAAIGLWKSAVFKNRALNHFVQLMLTGLLQSATSISLTHWKFFCTDVVISNIFIFSFILLKSWFLLFQFDHQFISPLIDYWIWILSKLFVCFSSWARALLQSYPANLVIQFCFYTEDWKLRHAFISSKLAAHKAAVVLFHYWSSVFQLESFNQSMLRFEWKRRFESSISTE